MIRSVSSQRTHPGSGSSPRPGWAVWAAVAVGAFFGTLSRYGLGLAFPEEQGAFPWTTLFVNVLGGALLGVLTGYVSEAQRTPKWVRAGLGPGLLGSFTTFSAVTLVGATERTLLIPYVGLSLLLGLAAAAAGLAAGRRSTIC